MIVTDVYPGKDLGTLELTITDRVGFLEASRGEPTDTAGENVTATKHGFQPWLKNRLRYVVLDGREGRA